ncbi:MarR family winged helix-turn-helix transcriptional regulator [Vagococcus jeotgali]|uniref:MarR family winged helix-turn-helix transcriptional regulator n=1 Tax=Vagococcus jeotgali TaxID=3109030 RepID=UPI002DD93D5F|nr:MarR family transcriptional regulator [Vagococcus sp. B2T-5]
MKLCTMSGLLYLMKTKSQEVTDQFEVETGFSLTRYELMMYVINKPQVSQQMIQTNLKIDRAAVTRHLKQLEENGYVIRLRNPDNNREVLVEATKKAVNELSACESQLANILSEAFLNLTSEELDQLQKLLNKLTLHLPKERGKINEPKK